jgi:hypothetical protein
MNPIQLIQRSQALTHRLTADYRATLDEALCSKTTVQALILLSMRNFVGLTPAKEILAPVYVVAVRQSFWRLVQAGYVQEEAQHHPRTNTLTHYNYALTNKGRRLADQINTNLETLIESVKPTALSAGALA